MKAFTAMKQICTHLLQLVLQYSGTSLNKGDNIKILVQSIYVLLLKEKNTYCSIFRPGILPPKLSVIYRVVPL